MPQKPLLSLACLGVALIVVACSLARAADNWPQFRGPGSLGTSDNDNLPDRWSATENVAWKADIPGLGWSSPIVWGDRVFVTTAVGSAGKTEAGRKGLYFGGEKGKPPADKHEWKLYCLSLSTGSVLWERTCHAGVPATPLHEKNTYASETPVTDGQRVYAYFGNVGVIAFDLDGKPAWSTKVQAMPMALGWGTASSPALHDGKLYIVHDNELQSYLVALDARTGEELWRTDRDEKSNWSTPFVWQNEKRTEIVTPGRRRVRSYDLAGKVVWEFKGMSSIVIATPYARDGLLYVSSGYVLDPLRPLYAIRPGASGDISLKDDATTSEYIAWSDRTAGPYNPSTLVYGDQLYVLLDRGYLASFDAKTGAEVYKKQRIPFGHAFTASPWAYGGKVFCANESGQTFVVSAGKDFKILHTNKLADDDMLMATPALSGDRLLLRTSQRLYCIRNSKPDSTKAAP